MRNLLGILFLVYLIIRLVRGELSIKVQEQHNLKEILLKEITNYIHYELEARPTYSVQVHPLIRIHLVIFYCLDCV